MEIINDDTQYFVTEKLIEEMENAEDVLKSQNANQFEKVENYDDDDFSVDAINEAIEKIRNIVGSISGELPLEGLSERIELYFDKVNEKNVNKQKLLN